MSSDYIPRLRQELLRAGASRQARWRPARVARTLRPLAAAAAVALVAVAVVLAVSDGGNDETPADQAAGAIRLSYRVEPSGGATTEQAAQVMRERLGAAGIGDAGVSVSSTGSLTITAPAAARADVTALAQRGRLAFYDWERSVLGPRGVPEPTDASVTGGGGAEAVGITRDEAEERAAAHPNGRVVSAAGAARDRWLALGGQPAMTHADVESAGPGVDRMTQDPIVTMDFTARGEDAFNALTRELARRGGARAASGVDDMEALQHFAIVLDDRIFSVPYIHFRQAPDGLDGASGAQIQGGLTPEAARRTAAILDAGPLPAELVLESADR